MPVALDATSTAVGWALGLLTLGAGPSPEARWEQVTLICFAVCATFLVSHRVGLYLARVTAVRLEELTRLLRAVTVVTTGLYVLARSTDLDLGLPATLLAGISSLLLSFASRSFFRAWLMSQRAAGRFRRPVLLVGANDEAAAMYDLLLQHPELGFDVVAIFGDRNDAVRFGLGDLWAGRADQLIELMPDNATGAIVAASALDGEGLNRATRTLLLADLHVHMSSRLAGFASRRLRAQSIAYEPIIYLERLELARWQTMVKRMVDIVIATILLIPASLVIALFALLIKLEDRGPAIFRQRRVGRDAKPFEVLKLRTMVVGAEDRLAELRDQSNERSGPLFKLEKDPRFTRVGQFMDITSINELPQLWNVLRGQMSIVGPRPALEHEHEQFSEVLQSRTVVRPGITGLWQVEARDNPSFDAYRRFDLHYVENWSVSLDMVILLATVEAVVSRLVRLARRSSAEPERTAEQGGTVPIHAPAEFMRPRRPQLRDPNGSPGHPDLMTGQARIEQESTAGSEPARARSN